MMSLDFIRLAILGNKSALGRLSAIFAGIALGTAMILLLVGAYEGLSTREIRSAWIKPVGEAVPRESIAGGATAVLDGLQDWYRGSAIARIDVYAPHGAPVTLPGIPAWPAAGTFYASPALARLIAEVPPDLLGDRFGTLAGTIDPETLKGPDVLAVIVGQPLERMLPRGGLIVAATAKGGADTESIAYRVVAAIGAIGMLSPVLLFVVIATRLGAASRRETFSALRLIGATPRQVSLVAGAETLAVSTAGAVAGIALAALFRPLAALFPINGAAFFPTDLDVGPVPTLLIAAGIVAAATLVSALAIRFSGIGPLGASRSMAERPARWWRILPLLAGLGMILAANPQLELVPGILIGVLLLGGFAMVTAGIVLIGPWLTAWLGRLVAVTASGPAGIIVANRIAQAPVATFRAVSGLVIAVFMVTVFSAASSGVASRTNVAELPNRLPANALVAAIATNSPVPIDVPGAREIIVGYGGVASATAQAPIFTGAELRRLGVIDAALDDAGRYRVRLEGLRDVTGTVPLGVTPVDTAQTGAPVTLVALAADTGEALERARTALEAGTDWITIPATRAELNLLGVNRILKELAVVAYTGAFITIIIAGCSLSLATLGSIIDRRRIFGLMRLMGTPQPTLDRVVFLEAAVPLSAVLALSAVAGYLTAWLILRVITDSLTVGAPDLLYFAFLALGLAVALAILQLARRAVRGGDGDLATRFD
ncbi:FtsX-like permease family protein [Devosia sp. 66-22]|uniref:FtsX-like permease family protein n=1 Tax=Devosia sp. 66-22 TaxID=1895753 RepID=UPI000A72F665|nr:FtsX-like permease family protein [Devosia sp. 66-22]